MNPTRVKSYALLGLVFALGALAGGGATYARMRNECASLATDESGEARERRRLLAFRRQLELDDAQTERVSAIFQRHRPERRRLMRVAFEQCGAPLLEQKGKIDAEVRRALRPEQQQRFDELVKAQREHFPFGRRSE